MPSLVQVLKKQEPHQRELASTSEESAVSSATGVLTSENVVAEKLHLPLWIRFIHKKPQVYSIVWMNKERTNLRRLKALVMVEVFAT